MYFVHAGPHPHTSSSDHSIINRLHMCFQAQAYRNAMVIFICAEVEENASKAVLLVFLLMPFQYY